MPQTEIAIATALHAWNQWLNRADKIFSARSNEELLTEIAPGKNRPIYIFGHLITLHDAMIAQLRLGESSFSHYWKLFIEQPDRAVELPPVEELRAAWKQTNEALSRYFTELPAEAWFERHASVSPEDFTKEPHRNRLAILLSRTAHLSYHIGQLVLTRKP
jgi:hypothetical protein